MSKQKVNATVKPAAKPSKPKTDAAKKENKNRNLLFILLAVIITAIVYAGSLGNGWVKNWDDGGYVLDHTNPLGDLVHKLTTDNIKQIFSVFYKGNYHPLTTLVYAFEYSIAGESPFLYHLLNLIFHLINVYLVYTILKWLTKRMEIAFIAALFFGIHPMHIESVAWISELKDVMYSFFFFGAMIYYYKFITAKSGNTKYYIIALLAFLLSNLSKSAAVTLPVILLLMDYYMKRKWNWKWITEKIPFFIIAFIFGIVAIFSQKSAGAIQDLDPLFAWWERPLLASYAAMMYLAKLFVPINLAAMYPYPDRVDGHLPWLYYIAPVVIITLTVLVLYSRKFGKDIVFGCLFFLITISLVLQLLPVGGAILAERYSYMPYIGLFLIIGRAYVFSQEGISSVAKNLKFVIPALIVAFGLFWSVLTFQRIKDWKDGEVLFTDLIHKYPNLPFAFNNRGYLYFNFIKNYDKALADYNKCIEIDSTFHRALSNRGVLYYNFYGPSKSDSLHLELALKDFTKALKYKPDNTDALIGRANTLSTLKRFKESLPDYDKYIKLMPDDAKAYLWRGIAIYNMGKTGEAIAEVNKSINMLPGNAISYLWRGLMYAQVKDYNSAITDYNKALQLGPDQTEVYKWRGVARFNLKQYNKAIADYDIYLQKNPKEPTGYVERSNAYFALKNYDKAFKDYCSAGDLRYALDKDHFFEMKALAGK